MSLVLSLLLVPMFTGSTPDSSSRTRDTIDISRFEDDIRHWVHGPGRGLQYVRVEASQVETIAENLLKFQNPDGGWPKNVDWLGILDYDTVWNRLSTLERHSTCDNRNTYTQIEYLSRAFTQTGRVAYRDAAARGLHFILDGQNASGGWRGSDVDAITFNDDLMTGVMHLLLDIREGRDYYRWIDSATHREVRRALARAVETTLRCQIVTNGRRTGWCQQHDHRTLEPVKARSYELPSVASLETAGVVEFLMRIPDPDTGTIAAVEDAVAWLRRSAITGIALKRTDVNPSEQNEPFKRYDVEVVHDPHAQPMWARYYEITTNRPFFCNRDGIKVYSLSEVRQERRIGYSWYGSWPRETVGEHYTRWRARLGNPK